MALALSSGKTTIVEAAHAPDLRPNAVMGAEAWGRARPVALGGFGDAPAQDTEVRALWNKDWFFFAFTCADRSVVSPGDRDGMDHFRLGDTAEVFLAPRGAKNYAEIHATPVGRKTFYFCRDYRVPAPAPPSARRVHVESDRADGRWRAFIAVPRDLLGENDAGRGYDVFFARYDYETEGARPSLSSFPVQHGEKPDFHRRGDYAILLLSP
jgi:hypothetical protein